MSEKVQRGSSTNGADVQLPREVADLVGEIEPIERWSINPDAVNNVAVIAGVQDKRLKLQRVLEIWSDYYKNERDLRKAVAKWVFRGLFVEIGFAIALVFCIGFGWIYVDKWVTDVFFAAVFSQVSAMGYWIVKSLFPTPKQDPLSQINDIVSKL